MTTISNLHNDQRYLFVKQIPGSTDNVEFRANFIDIIDDSIRFRKYCKNNIMNNGLMVTMPKIWIIKIQTFEETYPELEVGCLLNESKVPNQMFTFWKRATAESF